MKTLERLPLKYLSALNIHDSIQLILTICSFYSCKFASLLKFICNLKINTCRAFVVIHGHAQGDKKLDTFPAEVEQGNALFSYFNSPIVNKCPFCGAMFFTCLCFLLVISLFKWPPSVMLKCCLVFLSVRRQWYTFGDNMCVR